MALAGSLALLSGLLSGCIFSPDKGDGKKKPPPPIVYDLTRPQNVLGALELAYANRDSSGYRQLFELDYRGSTYDTSLEDGFQPGTFGRIDEERHIRALAENPNITSVTLDLGLPSQWEARRTTTIGDTGEEWALITVANPQTDITDGLTIYRFVAGQTFEFRFRPTVVGPELSRTDTLWHIVRWDEAP